MIEPKIHPALRNAGPSPTLAMNERARGLEAEGRTVYKFGFGQSPFPVPQVAVEALQANAHQKDYLPVRGLPVLREAVSAYHRRQDIPCSADDILIGPGSKQLMFLLLLVLEADLIIPAPSWVSYAPQARLLGRGVRWIQTRFEDGWRLRPEQLDDAAPGSLLVLNYPNNPTGLTYSAEELTALAAVARRRNLWILSDEIYAELHHQGTHWSIAREYPEGTFVTAGLSKWCGAGGWRVGTMLIPSQLSQVREALSIAASETYSCVAAPMQYAAISAYTDSSEVPGYLDNARGALRHLGQQCVPILRSAGIAVHDAECAFYLFPDFTAHREALAAKGIHTSIDLCSRLLDETGVALLDGTAFGQPPEALQARLAYVEEPQKTLIGVTLLAKWIKSLRT